MNITAPCSPPAFFGSKFKAQQLQKNTTPHENAGNEGRQSSKNNLPTDSKTQSVDEKMVRQPSKKYTPLGVMGLIFLMGGFFLGHQQKTIHSQQQSLETSQQSVNAIREWYGELGTMVSEDFLSQINLDEMKNLRLVTPSPGWVQYRFEINNETYWYTKRSDKEFIINKNTQVLNKIHSIELNADYLRYQYFHFDPKRKETIDTGSFTKDPEGLKFAAEFFKQIEAKIKAYPLHIPIISPEDH